MFFMCVCTGVSRKFPAMQYFEENSLTSTMGHTFVVFHLELHALIVSPLSLLKTVCKLLFWNCHKLSRHLSESRLPSEISSLPVVILALARTRSQREPNQDYEVAKQSVWCIVSPRNPVPVAKNVQVNCHGEGASYHLPTTCLLYTSRCV